MSVYSSNSLPNAKYSNLVFVASFFIKSSSGKTSLLVKNSYLLRFSDDKAKILVCLKI